MSLSPGTRLGRYEIRSLVGTGGMGEVYLAADSQLERTVALKILYEAVASDSEKMRRFVQEAKTTSALNHPNILTVHEVGQSDTVCFIATEFINGVTLRERIRLGPVGLDEALEIATQVASALVAAHEAGIVHRDIKPENIMVRPDGYVKVLDFGIAKLTEKVKPEIDDSPVAQDSSGEFPAERVGTSSIRQDSGSSGDEAPTVFRGNTESGGLLGTVKYMSPEQARGFAVDARSDIFSFGVVLYEMIAGQSPFDGGRISEIINSILKSEPEPLARYVPDVPVELEEIISHALAKGRAQRYQMTSEMAEDLRQLKQEIEFRNKLRRSSQSDEGRARLIPGTASATFSGRAESLGDTLEIASSAVPNNLPVQPVPLVGREEELKVIEKLLNNPDVRLLTLTGPGGSGKTRLGLEAATNSLAEFAGGVFLIALSSITAPELVASAITQTLGIRQSVGTSFVDALKQHLRARRTLLLLDNFEQVLVAAPLVAELLMACPQLKIMVTSRAALHLRGEREFEVPPLGLPDPLELPHIDSLSQYSAVALFLERAVAVQPDFALTDENARAVAEICIRLDGLPLAIELAAARLKLLSPAEMLARLEHRLRLLTGGSRDLPARQQTMRGTIGWSYDLLDENEKRLFHRLSIFVGGCTLEAVETVCSGQWAVGSGKAGSSKEQPSSSADQPQPSASHLPPDILDRLASLVDKSMLEQKEHPKGCRRFVMLETIREFGLEQLLASGDAARIERRHALYFLNLAEYAEPSLTGPEQVLWLERLEEEHNNIRAALRWSKENSEIELGLRIAGTMWRFWEVRGHQSEGRDWLVQLLEESDNASRGVRARAFLRAGGLERDQGNYDQALPLFQKGLALYRELSDRWGIAATLNGLGDMAHQQGHYEEATLRYEEALMLFKEINNQLAVAYVLNNLGNVARDQGQYERAAEIHEEALMLFRTLGDKRALATSLHNLGELARYKGEYRRAAELQRESLKLKREVGDQRGIVFSLTNLGDIARSEGDYKGAAALYVESLALCREIVNKRGVTFCLEGLADVARTRKAYERAAQLFGAAEALREAIGAPLPAIERADYERNVEATRAALSEEIFSDLWAKGRAMSLKQAIVYALDKD